MYLRPIISGIGNYYIEAQTKDAKRMDVIVDYLGEKQLTEYLDYYYLDKGYLLSFNFNRKKEVGVKELRIGNKIVVEAVVECSD